MVNKKQFEAFINYGYVPFSKSQCIKRLLISWIASAILCFVDNRFILWILPLVIIDLILCVMFILLIMRYSNLRVSRYLCDGVFYLYIALILNLTSYRILTIQSGTNWVLLIVLISLLVLLLLIFVFVTYSNIRLGRYFKKGISKNNAGLPFLGGIAGVLLAKLLLQGQSQQVVQNFLAYITLILSFIMVIPSINLLRAWLYIKMCK